MLNIIKIRNTQCTGCSACSNICPVDAIDIKLDINGFYRPDVNAQRCINCGACDRTCPVLNPRQTNMTPQRCYAAWASDDVRYKSSSGGAFEIFARKVLESGGIVFGAAWTENWFVQTTSVSSYEELAPLRKSKYAQSYIGFAYREVKLHLQQGRNVLFVGTPCQIAGLNHYLGTFDASNLVTVEFICYYNPPITILRRFLDDAYGLQNIDSFTFRDKKYGWCCHVYNVKQKNGQEFWNRDINCEYFRGYFSALYESDSCAACLFSGNNRQADITIADFWKIGDHDPAWDDGKGTSMLWINSEKGQGFFEQTIESWKKCDEVPQNWIRSGQHNSKKYHPARERFRELLKSKSFDYAVKMSLDKVYDIGFVCVQSYHNFGSALTNFALYQVLCDLKYSVLIVTQPLCSVNKPTVPQNFESSVYPAYSQAETFATSKEMSALNKNCLQFLVGSDQLFNYEIYKLIDKFVKLDWVDDTHKKIAYAASFGQDRLLGPVDERKALSQSLKRFHAFSVREDSGVNVAESLDVTAVQVLDPVFLCRKEHFEELARQATPMDEIAHNYMFCYILDPNAEKEKLITGCSKLMKLKYLVISDRWRTKANLSELWGIDTKTGMSNEQWISAIKNSKFVITDSFHGMCFAIIFKKEFAVIVNKQRGKTRFESLAKLLHIEKNLFYSEADALAAVKSRTCTIDYEQVDEILKSEKARSIEWLEQALDKPSGECLNQALSIDRDNVSDMGSKIPVVPLQNKVSLISKLLNWRKRRNVKTDSDKV